MKILKDVKTQLLAKPAVRQAYDAQTPEFELARELIAARTQAGLTQGDVAARMGNLKRGGTHRKWQGNAIHANCPTFCQRSGSA